MKLNEQWLRQWVNPSVTVNELAGQLTMAGLEVDTIAPVAGEFSQVVIGEVLATTPHPQADRLTLCRVNVGSKANLRRRTAYCGAALVDPLPEPSVSNFT